MKAYKKQRKKIILLAIALAAGLAYYCFVKATNMYIPCPIRTFTGFVCPGCGISHFFSDLISFNFASAFRQNLAIAILAPVWAVLGIIFSVIKKPTVRKKLFETLAWISVVILVAFGILRNIPALSFLLPLYMIQ